MNDSAHRVAHLRVAGQAAPWILVVILAVVVTVLWLRPAPPLLPTALAQNQPLAGARGVYAFTGQLDRDQYGLFMLDVDQGTIWCYAFDNVSGTRKLRLIAARSWIYDRYLQDFNCAEPSFREIQTLVNQQREQSAAPPRASTTEPNQPRTGERRPD